LSTGWLIHCRRLVLRPLKKENPMNGPKKNRLHDYEAGWLTLLVEMGVATKQEAHDAMCRVAQKAIDDRHEQRERRRADSDRRRKRDEG